MINGKPKKIIHDNGKQFTSKIFKRFLQHNNMKDKPIPNSYPQLQGKVEAYNKIVKNEFISVEAYVKHSRDMICLSRQILECHHYHYLDILLQAHNHLFVLYTQVFNKNS